MRPASNRHDDHIISSAALTHLVSPTFVKMAWKTHLVGHLRAVNNNRLDTYMFKSQNAVLEAKILSIEPVEKGYRVLFQYTHAEGEVEEITYDHVLACTNLPARTSRDV